MLPQSPKCMMPPLLLWPLVHVDIGKYWFLTLPVQVVENKNPSLWQVRINCFIVNSQGTLLVLWHHTLASTSDLNMNNISRLWPTTWFLISSMPRGDSNSIYIENWMIVKHILQSFYCYLIGWDSCRELSRLLCISEVWWPVSAGWRYCIISTRSPVAICSNFCNQKIGIIRWNCIQVTIFITVWKAWYKYTEVGFSSYRDKFSHLPQTHNDSVMTSTSWIWLETWRDTFRGVSVNS